MAGQNTFDALKALKVTEEFWKRRIASADIPNHPTTKGNVSEEAWRELLRRYLPTRYRVSTGFVISVDGGMSDQIDCVVYDNVFTPAFFGEHGLSYIPAEAVYAVFEIKPDVTSENIKYAADKVRSVRMLRRTTGAYIGDGERKIPKPHFHIIGGLMARKIKGKTWSGVQVALDNLQRPEFGLPPKLLDIVFTAESGVADYLEIGGDAVFSSDAPVSAPKMHSSEGSGLMIGILRLVQALQGQGTAPAVEWDEWMSKLKD